MRPTKKEINTYFTYVPSKGQFIWKDHWNSMVRTKYIGKIAGGLNKKGYFVLKLRGRAVFVHVLVWFVEKGYYAPEELDHINGDTADNRISNLRHISERNK